MNGIKTACVKLVSQYHPDKVQQPGFQVSGFDAKKVYQYPEGLS